MNRSPSTLFPLLCALACLALGAGCKRPKADGSFAPLNASSSANACKVDKDCVISCRHNGSCCDDTCHCSLAYARPFAASLDARWRDYCRGKRSHYKCPRIDCGDSLTRAVARCSKGRCVSVQVPKSR